MTELTAAAGTAPQAADGPGVTVSESVSKPPQAATEEMDTGWGESDPAAPAVVETAPLANDPAPPPAAEASPPPPAPPVVEAEPVAVPPEPAPVVVEAAPVAPPAQSAPEPAAAPPAPPPLSTSATPIALESSHAELLAGALAGAHAPSPQPPAAGSSPPGPISAPSPVSSFAPVATSLSGRPVPVITADDLEDDLRPGAFGARPSRGWVGAGVAGVAIAFALGLFVGRGSAPAVLPPVPVPPPAPEIAAAPPPTATTLPAEPASPAPPARTSAPASLVAAVSVADAPKGSGSGKGPFNAKAAKTNIANAAARIKSCKDASVPPGSASVVITFAPSGRVSDVAVTTPTYSSGRIGSCIVSKLKTAQVPPFSGGPETVKKVVAIK